MCKNEITQDGHEPTSKLYRDWRLTLFFSSKIHKFSGLFLCMTYPKTCKYINRSTFDFDY